MAGKLRTFALTALLVTVACAVETRVAEARVVAKIDISDQKMRVFVDGQLRHTWPISSGRRGHETPTGTYRPQRLEREWYSRKYDDAPMPYSVFFSGGYAIHGGHSRVGGPASHGCVRLTTGNAAAFFSLVADRGAGNTKIEIVD